MEADLASHMCVFVSALQDQGQHHVPQGNAGVMGQEESVGKQFTKGPPPHVKWVACSLPSLSFLSLSLLCLIPLYFSL